MMNPRCPVSASFMIDSSCSEPGDSITPELLTGVRLQNAIPEPKCNKHRGNDDRARHQKNGQDDP